MKTITITNPDTLLNKLIIAAKSKTCQEWEQKQEELTKDIGLRREIRLMDKVGRAFGMNTIQYDNEPYGVFIDNIWRDAHNYTVIIHKP